MIEQTLEFDNSEISRSEVVSIIEREMEQNAPFDVEVNGDRLEGTVIISSSMNRAVVDSLPGMTSVKLEATEDVFTPIREALMSQANRTDSGMDTSQTSRGSMSGRQSRGSGSEMPIEEFKIGKDQVNIADLQAEIEDAIDIAGSELRDINDNMAVANSLTYVTDDGFIAIEDQGDHFKVTGKAERMLKGEIEGQMRTLVGPQRPGSGVSMSGQGQNQHSNPRSTSHMRGMIESDPQLDTVMTLTEDNRLKIVREDQKVEMDTIGGVFIPQGRVTKENLVVYIDESADIDEGDIEEMVNAIRNELKDMFMGQ